MTPTHRGAGREAGGIEVCEKESSVHKYQYKGNYYKTADKLKYVV